jgi:ankyrin repeat protein
MACYEGRLPVVRLLVEKGADPSIVDNTKRWTPLIIASVQGHLEVVRSLLGHSGAKETINQRDNEGATALWQACLYGRGGVVRALLESGADPTISIHGGLTPMRLAKLDAIYPDGVTVANRRECVAALEVSFCLLLSENPFNSWLCLFFGPKGPTPPPKPQR